MTACITAIWTSSAACSPRCRCTAAWRLAFSSPDLGLPGLCGFIGEVFVTLSVWSFSKALAVISASVVILTAGYILWTLAARLPGTRIQGSARRGIYPMTPRELAIAVPLLAFAIVFGVYPQAVFRYMTPSVNKEVDDLAAGPGK